MPKLRHLDNTGSARFITFTCYRRQRYLSDPTTRLTILTELDRLRNNNHIKILGYVIMPEHVHLVLWPPDDLKMGPLIGQLKGRISRMIISGSRQGSVLTRADGRPAIWQRRCYDHNCREPHTVVEKINYCHKNPVTRGLVAEPDDWPWSSSRWYTGAGEVMLEIDGYEM